MPTSSAVDAYLLCATPRSGSTLLCGLLDSTGVAGHPQSYFRAQDEWSWADRWQIRPGSDGTLPYGDYLQAAVAEGSTSNGVFGARVMWGTLDELVTRLADLVPGAAAGDHALLEGAFGVTRFVHLWRSDTVAQAVSWARAEQTHFWHPGDAVADQQPRFDYDQIASLVQTIDEHNAAWRSWFARCDVSPLEVRYEELSEDPVGVTRQVLAYLRLELPDGVTIAPRDHRQADELNRDWIARFRSRRPA